MIDFLMISTRSTKRGVIEIYPKFVIKKSSDLMIRGGDFYAIWNEEKGLWSTDEQDVIHMVDRELDRYAEENQHRFDGNVRVLHMWDSESGMIDNWHKYCQRQMRDNFHMLDEQLVWSNTETTKKDYASKKLSYPLEKGDVNAWDKLVGTLYSEEERHKIEWAIGAIVSGDSRDLHKFMVFYGSAGTGKSTVIGIIQKLFEGYTAVFDAKALGSSSNSFALEAFKNNPLVAIQHDGDLSRIEDNTRLNSLVSHEQMTVNEKFKSTYVNSFKCFLFMGTNKPVKITDAKSGLIRRLVDVTPTGNKLEPGEYKKIMKQIGFELGHIAYHCQEVYLKDPGAYDDYIPKSMLGASNDFYNFVLDSWNVFKQEDETTLKAAWEMYKSYCEEAKVSYPYSQRAFKEELKNYFDDYQDRVTYSDGTRVRSFYSGFKADKFEEEAPREKEEPKPSCTIEFKEQPSIFDTYRADCIAQYASDQGTPVKSWDETSTRLCELDTSRLHYVRLPENHIVIDFDIPDENGEKSYEKNLEEASKWPPTYAELSKSGKGIHLHYLYAGDPQMLSRIYDDRIEIKVFTGKSSLRRKLTLCNDLPIATINSGLPQKEGRKTVSFDTIKSEKTLRMMIKKNLNKEFHANTKPSMDFIYKLLEEAYSSDLVYDVTDMRAAILAFAAASSNQSEYCIKLYNKMPFRSKSEAEAVESKYEKLVFYDVEVFPNLFLVNWKIQGEGKPVVRMINPKPKEIEELLNYRLVGFNCRRYDNHILYARLQGYSNAMLYEVSQRIISGDRDAFFGAAYNLSYTDVYDFCSTKQSLKKWEIELGIHHQELGLPWDQPVPEHLWPKVAEYCDNDVIATEAVFNARQADFTARKILAEIAGMTVNDTTNSLTTRIIFGVNREPQNQFNYRFMGNMDDACLREEGFDEFTLFDMEGRPLFPGYKFEKGVSTYRGEEVGEGGYVYSEPGMYGHVALLDVASMHPASIIAEELFGYEFTKRFQELRDARVAIKHGDFETAREMLGGVLAKYLTSKEVADDLAQALKIAINSVYGLTSAKFKNAFRDPRNVDNIVAKRGALFMINLKHEVQKRGFTVAHIKTDSIKIPDATPEIIKFVMDYGKKYGYTFEHEATYERMCLVNNAVYIAKFADEKLCDGLYGYAPKDCRKKGGKWTATGTQFQIPYVFKTLFTKDPIEFKDMCETKSVNTALILDFCEGKDEGEHDYHFVGKVGQFCPIKPGKGGGILYREAVNSKTGEKKFDAATGSSGYLWMESEQVQKLGKDEDIDRSFYDAMVNDAADSISKYGDLEWFVSDDPYIPSVKHEVIPPWSDPPYKVPA